MSPLRRWFREHGQPDWYSWVILISMIVVMAGLVAVTATVNARSIERERVARQASEQALCQVYVILDDVWHATPPPSQSGRELAAAVASARTVNHCTPRK